MTEEEWLACTDPTLMLEFLCGKASERKRRLFAVACCRQIWPLIRHRECQQAVEISELYADGMATGKQLRAAERKAAEVASELAFEATVLMRLAKYAAKDAAQAAALTASRRLDPYLVVRQARAAVTATPDKPKCQCDLLRCIFGTLAFRPVTTDPGWLAWNKEIIPKLAQTIYEQRRFDELPKLADTLEEAGCDNADLLTHCRQPGEHARGCWALDLLLGKT